MSFYAEHVWINKDLLQALLVTEMKQKQQPRNSLRSHHPIQLVLHLCRGQAEISMADCLQIAHPHVHQDLRHHLHQVLLLYPYQMWSCVQSWCHYFIHEAFDAVVETVHETLEEKNAESVEQRKGDQQRHGEVVEGDQEMCGIYCACNIFCYQKRGWLFRILLSQGVSVSS